MTAIATDGRHMLRSFVDHEHEELISGIDRLHEVAWDLPSLEALLRADLEREELFLLPLLDREQEAWAPEWRY
jgi:hypothetical protein